MKIWKVAILLCVVLLFFIGALLIVSDNNDNPSIGMQYVPESIAPYQPSTETVETIKAGTQNKKIVSTDEGDISSSYYMLSDSKNVISIAEGDVSMDNRNIVVKSTEASLKNTTEESTEGNFRQEIIAQENENSTISENQPYTIGEQERVSVKFLTCNVNEQKQTVIFKNDSDVYDQRFIVLDENKVIYDSGIVYPQGTAEWNAYNDLKSGFYRFLYKAEQYLEEVHTGTLSATVSITVFEK